MTIPQSMKKINKRIPGILSPPPKTEIDGKITNLSSKTLPELYELQKRQKNLLKNKSSIDQLPDKGAKIQAFLNKVEEELKVKLKAKEVTDNACFLLDNLRITDDAVQSVEWKGKIDHTNTVLDSDDESEPEDIIHIISQNTAVKKVKVLEPRKPLVTLEDLAKIDAYNEQMGHVKYIVEKAEAHVVPKLKGQFKPFKTTVSDVHNPEKEIQRKKHKNWEVTAATPPPITHSPAQVLSLEESLKLQQIQNAHLKEIQAQHAAEKLLSKAGFKLPELPSDVSKFGKYRDTEADSDDSEGTDLEGSDKEVHDEEPDRGGVVFTVMK